MLRSLSALAVLVLVWSPVAEPQTITEAPHGTVTDATDAVVSRAVVTVINTATGAEFVTEFTAAGHYVAPLLQPSRYRVAVERPERIL